MAAVTSARLSDTPGRLSRSAARLHLTNCDHAYGASPITHRDYRRTPSGGSTVSSHLTAASAELPVSRGRDLVASVVHDSTVVSHPRTPTSARSGNSLLGSPRHSVCHVAQPVAELRGTSSGTRRAVVSPPSTGNSGSIELPGNLNMPSSNMSRMAAAFENSTATRPPGSPRSYIPSGPGVISSGGASVSGGGMSRIPYVSQGGSVLAAPAKSSTCRSLDDGHMCHIGLYEASGSFQAAPDEAAPAATDLVAARGSSTGPFALVNAAWAEGLDGVHHSPDVTLEAPLEDGFAESIHRARRVEHLEQHKQQDDAQCAPLQAPFVARATALPQPDAAWQPPPLLMSAAAHMGSPFSAVAYSSPFTAGEWEWEAEAAAEVGPGNETVDSGPRPEEAAAGEAQLCLPGSPSFRDPAHVPHTVGPEPQVCSMAPQMLLSPFAQFAVEMVRHDNGELEHR